MRVNNEIKIDLTDYKPLPSQDKLHKSNKMIKVYFGGFGSGKTKWLCYEALYLSLEYYNNYGVILRKTYPELEDTTKKEFLDIVPDNAILKFSKTHNRLELVTGSKIIFRSFDDLDKMTNLNLGWFAIDQAEELTEVEFLMMLSRLRLPYVESRHALLASNIKGRNWLYKYFVEKKPNINFKKEFTKKIDQLVDYVVVETSENKYLPKDYEETLRLFYPESWQKRFIDATFDDYEGLVYKEFKKEFLVKKENIPDILIPKENPNYRYVIGIDTGINNPSGVLFGVIDFKNFNTEDNGLVKLYLFDEIYERNIDAYELGHLISVKIKKWNLIEKNIWKILIDPASFHKEQTSKTSVADIIQKKISYILPKSLIKADNEVVTGINKVNLFMREGLLYVYEGLEFFLDEISEYKYPDLISVDKLKEKNLSEKPKKYKDHLMDCLRYIISSFPLRWYIPEEKIRDENVTRVLEKRFKRKITLQRLSEGYYQKRFGRKNLTLRRKRI